MNWGLQQSNRARFHIPRLPNYIPLLDCLIDDPPASSPRPDARWHRDRRRADVDSARWRIRSARGSGDRAPRRRRGQLSRRRTASRSVRSPPSLPFRADSSKAADVIAVVLFVGGAWVLVDRLGTMTAVVGALVGFFRTRGFLAIPLVSIFFAVMGALENMEEEIIPLMPVLLAAGRRSRHRSRCRRGDERRRGDGRFGVRSDQSVSGGHRAEAGAAASRVRRSSSPGDVRARRRRVDRIHDALRRSDAHGAGGGHRQQGAIRMERKHAISSPRC